VALQVLPGCIGCGVCEAVCRSGAISQAETFAVVYRIDPLLCNDCADCVVVCPAEVIAVDRDWAVCFGRGCPLASARYSGWECSQGDGRCPLCGSMLWRGPAGEWMCSSCRLGPSGRGARCPKVEQDRRGRVEIGGTG
jgi:ferredoxin